MKWMIFALVAVAVAFGAQWSGAHGEGMAIVCPTRMTQLPSGCI